MKTASVVANSVRVPDGAVVVTGGLGFIGSHIADAYLDLGCTVVIIDSKVSSVISDEKYVRHPRCQVFAMSVEDFFVAGGSVVGAERVIHAGSLVGSAGILKYAGRVGPDIVRNAAVIIEDCIAHDVPLCMFSSAEVYGRSGELAETDTIMVPPDYSVRIEYAVAKTLTEALVANSTHRGLRGIVVRPFNVTGPRQSDAGGFVVPTFVQQALAGKDLTVFATGNQLRAFLSVTDLKRFLVEYMDAALDSGRLVFNIGNPTNKISIWDLAHLVRSRIGSDSSVVRVDAKTIHGPLYEEAESFEKTPALGAACKVGWGPEVGLVDLIDETISYYREIDSSRSVGSVNV